MDFLLAAMLTCSDGRWILEGIERSKLENAVRSELRIEILNQMPNDCDPGDYNPDVEGV